MSYLNSTTRKSLKKALNGWLIDRAMITIEVSTDTAEGGQIQVPTLAAASVKCRKIRATQSDVASAGLVGSQESIKDMLKVVFEQGTILAVDQQVTIDGITYNVIGLLTELTDELFESAIVTRQR